MTTKIFGIKNKLTGEFLSFGSKCAWLTKGYAKMAFRRHMHCGAGFDDCEYEIVDLTETYYILEDLHK